MKSWKDWLDVADKPEGRSPSESETAKRIRAELEAKLGHPLPPGAIVESDPAVVELSIDNNSTEDDITKQVVRALREMVDVVVADMSQKYKYSAAKLKIMVAEEFYRQATAQPTYQAKNFGDNKLVQ